MSKEKKKSRDTVEKVTRKAAKAERKVAKAEGKVQKAEAKLEDRKAKLAKAKKRHEDALALVTEADAEKTTVAAPAE